MFIPLTAYDSPHINFMVVADVIVLNMGQVRRSWKKKKISWIDGEIQSTK